MNNPWNPKLGCFGWLLLVAMCSWPFHLLGASDNLSIGIGVVLSIPVIGLVSSWHRGQRIQEMREAQDRR